MKKISILLIVALVSINMLSQESDISTYLNIKSFGAKGNGKTDDTPALLKAMEAATKSEGTVYFPTWKLFNTPCKSA